MTDDGVLRSDDGAFGCTPDHALDIAYMFNVMEDYLTSLDDGTNRLAYLEAKKWMGALCVQYLEDGKFPREIREEIWAVMGREA